jgi:NAD(P)-dependent dehydrogenase (short-subunit alcohol dehydrogenase family)
MNTAATGRGVLITGGGRRIGRALALALAADGWVVVVHANRSREAAESLVAEIVAAGGRAAAVSGDLARPDIAPGLIAAADEGCAARGARLLALINNASLFVHDDLITATPDTFNHHVAVNLRAPLFLTQALLARMGATERGCVINLLDNKIHALNPDYLTYSVTKVGLFGLTEMLALACAPRLRVCGIAPGLTLANEEFQTEETFARTAADTPLGVGPTPDDLARAVRFILETPSFTGRVITLDAGQSLTRPGRDVAFLD